jgi:hypothetical protein
LTNKKVLPERIWKQTDKMFRHEQNVPKRPVIRPEHFACRRIFWQLKKLKEEPYT